MFRLAAGTVQRLEQGCFDQIFGGDRRSPVSASGQTEPSAGACFRFDVQAVDLHGRPADMAMAESFFMGGDSDELRLNRQIQPGGNVFDQARDRDGAASTGQ